MIKNRGDVMSKKSGCPRGSHKVKGRCRSIKEMCYHDRCGHFVVHETDANKLYVMVRKRGGGNKRLYLDRNGNIPKQYRHKP